MIPPLPRSAIGAEGRVAQPQHGGDQHVEHRLLGVDVVVEEAALEPEPGVVDQQVDRPVAVGEPLLDACQGGPVGEVGGQDLDLDAVRRRGARRRAPRAGPRRGRRAPGRARASASWRAKLRPMPAVGPVTRAVGMAESSRSHHRCASGHEWPPMSAQTTTQPTVLAVANQKGGVAKTTTVASIGAALAELGHKVLLVDLDPQACLTFSLGIDPEDLELSVHHVLTKGLAPAEAILETEDGVDLLPATIELARAEADLLTRTGREHVLAGVVADLAESGRGVRLDPARLPALARRAHGRRADRRRGRADPAPVRDALAPRRRPAARHRPRRTPLHQPRPRGVGRAADAVRRPHQPLADGAGDDLGDLRPRGHRAADPQDDQVRRGAGRGAGRSWRPAAAARAPRPTARWPTTWPSGRPRADEPPPGAARATPRRRRRTGMPRPSRATGGSASSGCPRPSAWSRCWAGSACCPRWPTHGREHGRPGPDRPVQPRLDR